MKEQSQKFLKKRRFLTVLPLIVLLFLLLLFWLLGGGTSVQTKATTKTGGLNTQLPDANLKNQSALDKLSFYAMADRDSVKRAEQLRMDPNYRPKAVFNNVSTDESEASLNRKIARLQSQVDQPDYDERLVKKRVVESSEEIDRLQMMVQSISQKKTDPEIEALNGTLDKLLEIQNPGRIKQETPAKAKNKLFAVTANESNSERSYFGADSAKNTIGFLSDADALKDSLRNGTILAVVHNEQTLLVGSIVKLRLLQDVLVNGVRIPVGSFVFGNSSIDNERVKVTVTSIQFQNRLYPVALTVFDVDGLKGINIPGSAGREVIKESADKGIQSVGGLTFDPSLKAQAAAVGVNAAKSLFSKKVKLLRVTVKAGYRVLLKDENEKNN